MKIVKKEADILKCQLPFFLMPVSSGLFYGNHDFRKSHSTTLNLPEK